MVIGILSKKKETSKEGEYLSSLGYEVVVYNLFLGLDFSKRKIDLFLFDVLNNVSNVTDFETIFSLRKKSTTTPIMLMTNSNEKASYREKMLDLGVDMCLQSPFSKEELAVRVAKLLEKKDSLFFKGTVLSFSDVSINIKTHVVMVGGGEKKITKTEYKILRYLFLHRNRPVSQEELAGCLDKGTVRPTSVPIHILNLRKKLGNEAYILTVPHYGFRLGYFDRNK